MARVTRSKRLALNAAGEDVSDLTEAVEFVYQYVEPAPTKDDPKAVEVIDEVRYVPQTDDIMTKALAGFGFHTHCGNQVNKWVNPTGDNEALAGEEISEKFVEYRQMLEEGGWTNRKGEIGAGSGLFILAYARIRAREDGADVDEYHERIKAAWDTWDDDAKESIRKDDEVQAEILDIRAERKRAKAAKGEAKPRVALEF